jgi:hypothetical protein
VVAVHIAERVFLTTLMFSRQSKVLVAVAILTIGLFSTWREQSLSANAAELAEQLKEWERQAADRRGFSFVG